jgi:hypothetical protein
MLRIRRVATLPLFLSVAAAAGAQTISGAVLAKREPHHHPVYEDTTIRVLRVRVPPHDTTLLHEHDSDYFWIALGQSNVVNAKPGVPDAIIASSDLSIHYTPGHFAHVARNPGDAPFDNITVELLNPQTHGRNLCEPALAGQPMSCVNNAGAAHTSERPAFETDQLRVALVTIAPGRTLQSSRGKRAWVIALDTADTRAALSLASGGRWVGGVYAPLVGTWSIRNLEQRPVRVLTIVAR